MPGVPLFKGPEELWVKCKFPGGQPLHSPRSPALEVGTVPSQLVEESMSIPSPPPVQMCVVWPKAAVEDTAQVNPIRNLSSLVAIFIQSGAEAVFGCRKSAIRHRSGARSL